MQARRTAGPRTGQFQASEQPSGRPLRKAEARSCECGAAVVATGQLRHCGCGRAYNCLGARVEWMDREAK